MLMMATDEQGNETVQQLTPQLVGVFEKVMGAADEQLEPTTREVLSKTVQMLYKAKAELLSGHPGLLQLACGQ